MASIDERVLSMRFDNSQFESAIKSTLGYLDKLKSSLKLGGNASSEFGKIESAAKNVSFQELYSSVEQVSSRFSTLGIVGTTALANITNSAVNTGKKIVSSLLDPLVAGGKRRALNIEQAKFQIKGLGYAWEDVSDDIDYAVSGTAYGLDVAAKAASQLLASNVATGDSMKAALRGISGVAAMTSSEYEDIANVFTTVAGNGRLMASELNRISARGLNAAAALGEYLHVSEAEVRDMTSKGKIDFQTFANAMDAAFGEHAKKANDTFTGALSNMKAALSRIGADFATPSYEMLRNVFLSLTQVINGVKDALKPVVETFAKGTTVVTDFVNAILPVTEDNATRNQIAKALAGPMEQVNRIFSAAARSLANIAQIIGRIVIPIFQSFSDVLGVRVLSIIADALEVFEHFTSQLIFTDRITENLKKTFDGIFTIIKVIITVLSKLIGLVAQPLLSAFSKAFGLLADIVTSITGHIGELVVKAHEFIYELLQLDTVQFIFSTFRNILAGIREALYFVYNGVRDFADAVIDTAFAGATVVFSKMADAIRFVVGTLDKAITAIRDFVKYVWELPYVQEFVSSATSSFWGFIDTVKSTASVLKEKFIDAFQHAKVVVGEYIGTIRELIGQYVQLPTFQEVVSRLQNFVTSAFEKSQEIFKKVAEVLGKVFDRVKEINEVSFKTIIENFTNLRTSIVDVVTSARPLETIVNAFIAMKNGIAEAIKTTGGVLELAKAQLSNFLEWVQNKFGNITLGDVIAAGVGISAIPFLIQLTKLLGSFDSVAQAVAGFAKSITGITDSITDLVNSMQKVVKAKANSMYMTAVAEIIKSIALLGAAVALLAAMDPERVQSSALALGILGGAMIAMIAITNKISSTTEMKDSVKSIGSLITIAGSMLLLAIALRQIGSMNIGQIITSVIALGVVMAELAAFAIVLDKFAPTIEKSSFSFVSMAVALILMSHAMGKLSSLSITSLLSGLAVLGVMISFLALAGKIDVKGAEKSALQLIAVAVAINLMIRAIKSIAEMNGAELISGLVGLLGLIAIIMLVLNALGKAGEHAAKAGVAILLISVAMHLMVSALKKMAELDSSTIDRATNAISSILMIFALIIASTKLAGEHAARAAVTILAVSAAMIIMAASIAVLSKIDPDGLQRATQAINSIMLMFALIIASTSVVRQADKTMKMIAITVGVLAASLAILSLIEPSNLLSASLALSMVMGMFSLMVHSTGSIVKSSGTIALMLGVVAGLALVLAALAQLNVESVIGVAASISALLLSISSAALILSHIPATATASVPAIAAIVGIVAGIATVLVAIGGLVALIPGALDFIQNGIPVLEAVGNAIGSFIGGLVGGVLGSASNAIVTLGENLETFSFSFQSFLSTMSTIDDSSIKGIESLTAIILALSASNLSDGLSRLMSGPFGIFGSKSNVFDDLTENLPKFAETLKTFGESMKDAEIETISKSAESIRNIIEAFSDMPTEGFSLKGFIFGSSDLHGFSEQLKEFGTALVSYSETVSAKNAIDTKAINTSVESAKSLVEIAKAISEMAINDFWTGNKLSNFSTGISSFSEGLTTYSAAVSAQNAINPEAINSSVEASYCLVDIAKSISEMVVNDFWTGNKLSNFATGISSFGDGLVSYSKSISAQNAINPEAINTSVEAAKSLVDIARSISEMTITDFWTGNQLTNFATGISSFGNGLSNYSKSITGENALDNSAIKDSIAGAKGLAKIADTLSGMKITDFWTGNQLSNFATGIKQFGNGLTSYSKSITGENALDNSAIKNSIAGAKGLAELAGILASGDLNIPDELFRDLPNLATALQKYSATMATVELGPIEDSIDPVSGLLQGFSGLNIDAAGLLNVTGLLPKISEAYKSYSEDLASVDFDVIRKSITAFSMIKSAIVDFPEVDLTPFETFASSMKTLGEVAVDNLSSGLIESSESVVSNCNAIMENIVSAMQGVIDSNGSRFNAMGTGLLTELIKGLESKASSVSQTFTNTLQSAITEIKRWYSDFIEVGQHMTDGLVEGIQNGTNNVVAAIRECARQSVEAANQELDINSPSKVFEAIGAYETEGWGIGIQKKKSNVIKAISNVAKASKEAALDSMDDALYDSLDFNPTITPVLDLSKMNDGFDYISSKFDKFGNFDLALSGQIASVRGLLNPNAASFEDSVGKPVNLTQNFAFNQTNNSPKALSNIDIYRQTNNQFTRFAAAQHARVVPQSI